jgi:hypothetical protein
MRTQHDEHGNMIDDEAISNFISSIDTLPSDEWRARTLAFEALIESLPSPNEPPAYSSSSITPWYKSHIAMRRLFKPLSNLLLDARSTVAKHICTHLAFLVQRIKALNTPHADTCKYLLKDLLPTILSLHAQTVKLIRGYAAEMMNIIIPLCRFKSGLPVILERMRKDKSRDVREVCVKYLRLVILHWAREVESQQQEDYLTPSICLHIGNGLARALMDPSQHVRIESRNAFELFRFKYPDIWNQIVQKKDGILSKDSRLKKSIINEAMEADVEGRTGSANYYPTYEEGEDYDGKSIHSNGSRVSWQSNKSFTSRVSAAKGVKGGYRNANPKRPTSRPRARPGSGSSGLSGPPKRTPVVGTNRKNLTLPLHNKNGKTASPQIKGMTKARPNSNEISPRPQSLSNQLNNLSLNEEPRTVQPSTNSEVKLTSSCDNDNAHDELAILSSISTGQELMSSSVSTKSNTNGNNAKPSENYQVATQLLSSHKTYIDELMESLRNEMSTVREFEVLLMQTKSSATPEGTYGPNEDEVLKYFEAVYGFLEKGTENGTKLREAMERISANDLH